MTRPALLSACIFYVSVACSTTSTARLEDEVFIRVVDVGAGECCVVKMPGNHYMVYDAGNYTDGGERAADAVAALIPEGSEIDLMVLSHSDSDHLGAVDEICDRYKVKRIIHSGMVRTTATWVAANNAINSERDNDGCKDINLSHVEFPPGATYRFGDVFVTMVCGFGEPPAEWGALNDSERKNAGSVVIRLLYKGKSVLFCGDSVGRHIGDPVDACIAAEKFMVDNVPAIAIDSDVMIAPHHGADNGSSTAFVQAVRPTHVVFSAGHKYQHPRAVTAQRYLDNGVELQNMFRTDRGDDEGATEWDHGRTPGHSDPAGDDDVDIRINSSGQITVGYRN